MATKSRKLFEEVGDSARQAPIPGGIDKGRPDARWAIRLWLVVMFAMVVAMIIVGGLTRLTDSGLSITEWNPISGAIPPLTHEAWMIEFEKYQQIPQFALINSHMTLSDFQFIFWWEWSHRQLGRALGVVWFVGFVGFWVAGRIPKGWTLRLFSIGILGAIQGAVGWWMVHSGLSGEMVAVASYRLATHLGLAFVTLGVLFTFWLLLERSEVERMVAYRGAEFGLARVAKWFVGLVFVQILLGALVAGIDAGRGYPTWPLMGDGFLPPDMFLIEPLWRNFFENDGTVQFVHRMMAYFVFAYAIFAWRKGQASPNSLTRFAFNLVFALVLVQVGVGIATALLSAPLSVAILHQFLAVTVICAALFALHLTLFPKVDKLRS